MKKNLKYLAIVLIGMVLVGCQQTNQNQSEPNNSQSGTKNQKISTDINPTVQIEMMNGKVIELELYTKKAPNTVANFVTLADSGFYNNVTFHRVISGFMIQGGDPLGDGTGGPDYSIKGEFSSNGVTTNDLKHERGVISMARSSAKNSAGSQFFIMHQTSSHLDGEYAAFGKVTNGIEVVDEIAAVGVDANDKPTVEQKIKTIKVDKKDGTFTVEKLPKSN